MSDSTPWRDAPWELEGLDVFEQGGDFEYAIIDSNGDLVATVPTEALRQEDIPEARKAEARLIAAAPNLVKALEEVLNTYRNIRPDSPTFQQDYFDATPVLLRAESLLREVYKERSR